MSLIHNQIPLGWDEDRVKRVLKHYESQSDEGAVAADEAALDPTAGTVINVPNDLLPQIRELIARHKKSA